MGAIGGAALWVIAAYWNAKENDKPVKKPEGKVIIEDKNEKVIVEHKKVIEPTGKHIRTRRYGESARAPKTAATRRFGWLFKKK